MSSSVSSPVSSPLFPPRADLFPADGMVGRLDSFPQRLEIMKTGDPDVYRQAVRSGGRLVDRWVDLVPVLEDLVTSGQVDAVLWLLGHAAAVLDLQDETVQKDWRTLGREILLGTIPHPGILERLEYPDIVLTQALVLSARTFGLPNPLDKLSHRVAGSCFAACLLPVLAGSDQEILPVEDIPGVHRWLRRSLAPRDPQDHEPGTPDRRLDLAAAATLVRIQGKGGAYLTSTNEIRAFQKRLKAWGRSNWSLLKNAAHGDDRAWISSGYSAWPTPHSSEELLFACAFSDTLADWAATADAGVRAQMKDWLNRPAAGRPEGVSALVFARASRSGRTNLIRHVFPLLGTTPLGGDPGNPTIVHYLLRVQPDLSTVRAFARYWGPEVFTLTDKAGKVPLDYVRETLTVRGPTSTIPARIAQMEQAVLQFAARAEREAATFPRRQARPRKL